MNKIFLIIPLFFGALSLHGMGANKYASRVGRVSCEKLLRLTIDRYQAIADSLSKKIKSDRRSGKPDEYDKKMLEIYTEEIKRLKL